MKVYKIIKMPERVSLYAEGLLVGTTIIEVEGMGGALFPKEIAWLNLEHHIDKFYKLKKATAKPPPGTVCFQKVEVLS